MRLNPYQGLFVAIEGLDGSSSNEISLRLVKTLVKQKLPVVFVKEPSLGPIGRFIRKLLQERRGKLDPLTLEFLFASDRALQIEERIIPSLKDGKVVVADRCLWSSIAYRSPFYSPNFLLEINREFFLPDLTFFIDVDPRECAKKINENKDEVSLFETENMLSRVRDGYEWILEKFGYCFAFLDGTEDGEKLVDFIVELINKSLRFRKFQFNS